MENLENIIQENKKLIYKICSFYPYQNKEDLFQVGCIGLINAYKKYDETLNTKFTTYAYPFILGEINTYVKKDKGIKISREISKLNRSIEKASILLTQKLSREPSIKELAEYLEIDEKIIADSYISKYPIKSFDSVIKDDGKELTLQDIIPDINTLDITTLLALKDELNKLTKEERNLIESRYMMNLTQKEIANDLGISQVQVSRAEQKVLTKLRNGLKT